MALTIKQLPKQAQEIAEHLSVWCVENNILHTFNAPNGAGHPGITFSYKGQQRKMSFTGGKTDPRAKKNCLTQLKKKLVEIGWKPPAKESPLSSDVGHRNKPKGEDLFKRQKTSSGPASKVTTHDPKVIMGVSMPKIGASFIERNEAVLQALEKGATDAGITKALAAAGWSIAEKSISAMGSKARKVRRGENPQAVNTGGLIAPAKPKMVEMPAGVRQVGNHVFGVAMPSIASGRQAKRDRNEAMLTAFEKGATGDEIHAACEAAGWNISRKTVGSALSSARDTRAEFGKPIPIRHQRRDAKDRGNTVFKTVTKEAPPIHDPYDSVPIPASTPNTKADAQDIALEIAQAIAPIIQNHLTSPAAMRELQIKVEQLKQDNAVLKRKADKFDALKGVLSE